MSLHRLRHAASRNGDLSYPKDTVSAVLQNSCCPENPAETRRTELKPPHRLLPWTVSMSILYVPPKTTAEPKFPRPQPVELWKNHIHSSRCTRLQPEDKEGNGAISQCSSVSSDTKKPSSGSDDERSISGRDAIDNRISCKSQLFQVVLTLSSAYRFPCLLHCGEQQCNENGG